MRNGIERPPAAVGPTRLGALADEIRRHPVRSTFLVALAVRLVVATAVLVVADGDLFFDDMNYQRLTSAMLDGTIDRDPTAVQFLDQNWAYLYPIAGAKWLLGGSPIGAQLLVAVVGAGTAAITVRIAMDVLRVRHALVAGAIVGLLPSMVLWSSLSLKDPFVWLLGSALCFVFVRERQASTRRLWLTWFASSLVLLVLLEGVRDHTFVIVLLASVLACLVVPGRDRALRFAVAVALALALPIPFGHGPLGIDILTQKPPEQQRALNAQSAETAVVEPVIHPESAPERQQEALAELAEVEAEIAEIAASAASPADPAPPSTPPPDQPSGTPTTATPPTTTAAGETGTESVDRRLAALQAEALELRRRAAQAAADLEALPSGVLENVLYLPKGVGLMLLEPYVWEITDNSSVRLAAAEHVLWYPIVLLALVGLVGLPRRRALLLPFLIGGAALGVMALNEGNFGTAYRHRSEIVWVVALLAAVGVAEIASWRRRRSDSDSVEAADGIEPSAMVL